MMTPKRIGLIGFDRVTALHLVGPADAFSAAALDDGYGGRIPCYEVWTVGIESKRFDGESGVAFTALTTLNDAPEFDTIIVAGGSGIRADGVSDAIASWILLRAGSTRRIGAICTGIFGLAPTGLLDGRDVTVHWRSASDLARRFPRLKVDHRKALVRSGHYFTSSGLSAGINLSLAMISEDYGPHVAQSVSRDLALSPTEHVREDTARSVSSDTYPTDKFADLVAWIVRNLDSDLSVEALARRACICPSHFSKAFKSVFGETPSNFVENLRLNEARRRLSKQQKTLRSVATSVGFKDGAAFQRAFERRFGTRPSRCLDSSGPKRPVASRRREDDDADEHKLALVPAA
jgi:transcriptional regulator GlxA family with amidase domain